MNHVFLSGIAESAPRTVSHSQGVLHAAMDLTVTHTTSSGVEKRERYPISAWRGIAKRMTELVRPGSRVSVKGYLSQKQTQEGVFLEVTAEEFQVSARSIGIRPARRIPLASSSVRAAAENNQPAANPERQEETAPAGS